MIETQTILKSCFWHLFRIHRFSSLRMNPTRYQYNCSPRKTSTGLVHINVDVYFPLTNVTEKQRLNILYALIDRMLSTVIEIFLIVRRQHGILTGSNVFLFPLLSFVRFCLVSVSNVTKLHARALDDRKTCGLFIERTLYANVHINIHECITCTVYRL